MDIALLVVVLFAAVALAEVVLVLVLYVVVLHFDCRREAHRVARLESHHVVAETANPAPIRHAR